MHQAALENERRRVRAQEGEREGNGLEDYKPARPSAVSVSHASTNGSVRQLSDVQDTSALSLLASNVKQEDAMHLMNGYESRKRVSPPSPWRSVPYVETEEDKKMKEIRVEETAGQIWSQRKNRIMAALETKKTCGVVRPLCGWENLPQADLLGEWEDARKCVFCRQTGEDDLTGRLLVFDDYSWAHSNCALWSSEVTSDDFGVLSWVAEARKRSKSLQCVSCKAKGATVGCCHHKGRCKANFHFMCALGEGAALFQDHESKKVLCKVHKKDLSISMDEACKVSD